MDQVTITKGSAFTVPIQIRNRGGAETTGFNPSDSFSAYIYRGQDQPALFAPSVSWLTTNITTRLSQNGYDQGQLLITGNATDSATLEASGNYLMLIWWDQLTTEVARVEIAVLPEAGTSTQTIVPYCTYQDVLDIAGWVQLVQNSQVDQEGFYSQRLKARTWMDWAIINNYRGASVGTLEMHSVLAFNFGGGYGRRRSVGPSPSLIQYLAQDKLIVRPQIVQACAHYTAGVIGMSQIGVNNVYAQYGLYHREMALREAISITAEVDLTNTGVGSIFVPLSSTNTINT